MLSDVGALPHDAIDARIIDEVRSRSGRVINSQIESTTNPLGSAVDWGAEVGDGHDLVLAVPGMLN